MGYLLRMANRDHILILIALASLTLLTGGCAKEYEYQRTASYALANPEQTTLGRQTQIVADQHPGQSGFSMLYSGHDAFVARAVFIDASQRTLDAQYFIFKDDLIGSLLLERLFAAADRGVRIRLLLDDWSQAGEYRWLAGIGAHPNIQVRIFNPIGGLHRWQFVRPLQYVSGPARVDRRMHNKALIIDNSIAFVGGRDIADVYFSARDDLNYQDLDLMAAGPIAKQVSAAFDQFWNDPLAVPIEAYVSNDDALIYLKGIREEFEKTAEIHRQSQYIQKLKDSQLLAQLNAGQLQLIWAAAAFVCDPPAKITASDTTPYSNTAKEVENIVNHAQKELLLISPYFVGGQSLMADLKRIRNNGVTVKLLINSLASTDHISTYGGLESYRKSLLAAGVRLYEIKPEPTPDANQKDPVLLATLHTKCYIADANTVYVGSMNLDRRSIELDTQDGIIVYGRIFGSEAASFFGKSVSPDYSYRVIADDNTAEAIWVERKEGRMIYYRDEPQAGVFRRFAAWLSQWTVPEQWL
jgi:putative cardiolipin synthase